MGNDHYIAGNWQRGAGPALTAIDPAAGSPSWTGHAATPAEVAAAVAAARAAAAPWADLPVDRRMAFCQAFAAALRNHEQRLAEAICISTGKPLWEAQQEVGAMVAKVPVSVQAMQERRGERSSDIGGARAVTRFKPHGVLVVLGPFNLPGHLPNGHIIPALLAGNTLVFKPSEQTPLVGQRMLEIWHEAGLPAGVINMVQGGRDTGIALARHDGIDGLLFTGSYAAGLALSRTFAEHPERILALEMGGNNPLIIDSDHISDLDAAAYHTIQSAYITAGQRCTCARRLIVIDSPRAQPFIHRLVAMIRTIRVGRWNDDPTPFMGPVISKAAAEKLLAAQAEMIGRGGAVLAGCERRGDCPAMLTPGLIDVTGVPKVAGRGDVEHFGPLLQLIRVPDFDTAMAEANDTDYGLAAGLFSESRERFDAFYRRIRAGVVSWNRQTTAASGQLPFGGIGHSGNHRPSGYYAADYCSYPVASLEYDQLALPASLTPGVSR
jgi:succinylglutamic semialdehyde dehydrogenase